MSFPHYDLVERAYAELVSDGLIAPRVDHDQIEQDKGLLTRRAGYYVNTERDPSIGILAKETGNNSLGYSVDLLIKKTGTFWDVASDDGRQAIPVDGGPSGPDPQLAKDGWRQPTAELAGLKDQESGGADLTAQAPPYDESYSVQFGNACNTAIAEADVVPDGGMIAVYSMRCAYDYYVAGMAWEPCYTKHVTEFRAEYGLPPVDTVP